MSKDEEDWQNIIANVKPLNRKKRLDILHNHKLFNQRSATDLHNIFDISDYTSKKSYSAEKSHNNNLIQYLECGSTIYINRKQLKKMLNTYESVLLDLHHHTLDQAFDSFIDFVEQNFHHNQRVLHVITGKGTFENPSSIRGQIETWINHPQIQHMILFFDYEKNNEGCFQIVLRKNKNYSV